MVTCPHGSLAGRPNVEATSTALLRKVSYFRGMKMPFILVLAAILLQQAAHGQSDSTFVDSVAKFSEVEVKPEFPGGEAAFYKYLQENIRYPREALERGVQGKVWIEFVIDKDGGVIDAKVARGVALSLDAEAVRVVSEMPKWKPGYQKGKAIKVKYTMPINFALHNGGIPSKKKKKKR